MLFCLISLSLRSACSVACCPCGHAACDALPRICTPNARLLRCAFAHRARAWPPVLPRARRRRPPPNPHSIMMNTTTTAKKLAKKAKELKRLSEARNDVDELHSEPTIHEPPVSAFTLSPARFSTPTRCAPIRRRYAPHPDRQRTCAHARTRVHAHALLTPICRDHVLIRLLTLAFYSCSLPNRQRRRRRVTRRRRRARHRSRRRSPSRRVPRPRRATAAARLLRRRLLRRRRCRPDRRAKARWRRRRPRRPRGGRPWRRKA